MGDAAGQPLPDSEQWEALAQQAGEWLRRRQADLIEEQRLADSEYLYSLDDASILWSRDESVFLRGRITVIGSVHVPAQSWLWSWANTSLPPAVLGDIDTVREYGEQHRHTLLTTPTFHSHSQPVDQATSVAAYLLGAAGLWRHTRDELHLVFALHELQPG